MKKFLNKKLETAEQLTLGQKYDMAQKKLVDTQEELRDKYFRYYEIEGKYANGTKIDEFAEQGCRGYSYVYATETDREKEITERENYHNNYIKPLQVLEAQLINEMTELKEQLCFALYGYNLEKYAKFQHIAYIEKQIKKLTQEIEDYNKYLIELKKEVI